MQAKSTRLHLNEFSSQSPILQMFGQRSLVEKDLLLMAHKLLQDKEQECANSLKMRLWLLEASMVSSLVITITSR